MRKIFLLIALTVSLVIQGQTWNGDYLNVRKQFTFNGYYVTHIKNDTISWSTGTRYLPTAKAVYDFVNGRVGAGKRFGISGEDTAADQNREFDLGNFGLKLLGTEWGYYEFNKSFVDFYIVKPGEAASFNSVNFGYQYGDMISSITGVGYSEISYNGSLRNFSLNTFDNASNKVTNLSSLNNGTVHEIKSKITSPTYEHTILQNETGISAYVGATATKGLKVLATSGDILLTEYPNTRNDGATTKALYVDATGNVKYGAITASDNTDSLFGKQDNSLAENRTVNGHGAYNVSLDSLNYFSSSATGDIGADDYAAIFTQDATVGNQLHAVSNFSGGRNRTASISGSATSGIASLLTTNNDDSASSVSTYIDKIILDQSNGNYEIDDLPAAANMTGRKVMVWNETNNKWEQIVKDSIGGGVPIESTYTPTLFNTTNIAASTASVTHYIRIGDWVHVWGVVDIDATAATTISELGMSLPIGSTLTSGGDLAGTASYEDNTSVAIKADTGNGRAQFRFTPQTDSNNKYSFHFSYKYVAP